MIKKQYFLKSCLFLLLGAVFYVSGEEKKNNSSTFNLSGSVSTVQLFFLSFYSLTFSKKIIRDAVTIYSTSLRFTITVSKLIFISLFLSACEQAEDTQKQTAPIHFGGEEINYYFKSMVTYTNKEFLSYGDDVTHLYFKMRIDDDGSFLLYNENSPKIRRIFKKEAQNTIKYNWVRFELIAELPKKDGQSMTRWMNSELNNKLYDMQKKPDVYGLHRVVKRDLDGSKFPTFDYEYYFKTNDDVAITFIDATFKRDTPHGSLTHYFMLTDRIQVEAGYNVNHLKNWQLIEKTMRDFYHNNMEISLEKNDERQ